MQLRLESTKGQSSSSSPITFPANQPVTGISIKGRVGNAGWLRFSINSENTDQLYLDIPFKLAPCPWGFAMPHSCLNNDVDVVGLWTLGIRGSKCSNTFFIPSILVVYFHTKNIFRLGKRIADTRIGNENQTKKNELARMRIEPMAFRVSAATLYH